MEGLAAYVLLGAVTGFLGGLFGIGGGTILVPVLVMLFGRQGFPAGLLMHLALGTSMACIIFTALASARKHHQLGAVDWGIVRRLTPGIVLGAALGTASALLIAPRALSLLFGGFLVLVALQMLFNIRPAAARMLPGAAGMTAAGALTGWLSSLVSIGGGTVVVPFLLWCNVPLRRTIGTSAAIGFPVALSGSVGYALTGATQAGLPPWTLGFIYLPALFGLALATLLTAPLGAQAAHRLPVNRLRQLFAVVLLVLAAKMLWPA